MMTNSTSIETTSWQWNSGRGTWDIISSCVLTLVLCVWTSLHLNVPKENSTFWEGFNTKARWVIIGVLAPEMVVYFAWSQYCCAKWLQQEIQSSGADGSTPPTKTSRWPWKRKNDSAGDVESPEEIPLSQKRHPWTMSHCYMAVMGGFAHDTRSVDGPFIPGSPRLTFTGPGIDFLATTDSLPSIPLADIKDKSKADGLAKALVCLQASWMVLQSLGRIVQKLPITLLEINTIGHCFCALIIYLIWWNKPLDVREPILLQDQRMREYASWCYMASHMREHEKRHWYSSLYPLRKGDTELHSVGHIRWQNIKEGQSSEISELVPHTVTQIAKGMREIDPIENYKIRRFDLSEISDKNMLILEEGEILDGINIVPAEYLKSISDVPGPDAVDPATRRWKMASRTELLSTETLRRWKLTSDFIAYVDKKLPSKSNDLWGLRQSSVECVAWKTPNFANDDVNILPTKLQDRIIFSLIAFSAAYGGLHLASWHLYFPSTFERWMWIASASFIAFGGLAPLLLVLINIALVFLERLLRKSTNPTFIFFANVANSTQPEHLMDSMSDKVNFRWFIFSFVPFLLVILLFVVYVCARSFIVVEAFISLRQLPLSYYDTPNWSNFIPHL